MSPTERDACREAPANGGPPVPLPTVVQAPASGNVGRLRAGRCATSFFWGYLYTVHGCALQTGRNIYPALPPIALQMIDGGIRCIYKEDSSGVLASGVLTHSRRIWNPKLAASAPTGSRRIARPSLPSPGVGLLRHEEQTECQVFWI